MVLDFGVICRMFPIQSGWVYHGHVTEDWARGAYLTVARQPQVSSYEIFKNLKEETQSLGFGR